MRHAKSDGGAPELPDHDRPLTGRGQCDAPRMAHWIADQGAIPERILASTAVRVRETVDAVRGQWSDPPPVSYSNDLYLAPPETILRCVRSDALDAERVMVVGHNPGLAVLVALLSGQSYPMPPAGVVVFRLRLEDWQKLSTRSPVESITYSCPSGLDD